MRYWSNSCQLGNTKQIVASWGRDGKHKIQIFEMIINSLFKTHFHIFFSYSNPRQWTVTFGVSTTFPKQRRRVRTIIIHSNYISATHENDIAAIQLDRGITFTKNIHKVCLPEATLNIPSGSIAYVTGWGSREYGGKCLWENNNNKISWDLLLCKFFKLENTWKTCSMEGTIPYSKKPNL